MMAFVGLILLFLGVPIQIAGFLAARWAVAVVAGVPGAWVPFRRFDVPPKGVPRWARLAVAIAGPAATYLIAVLCFVGAMRLSSKPEYDATVDVRPGSPAELAGIRSGDRVLSIQGRPVSTFDDISARVREFGRAGSLEIVVERGGVEATVVVTPTVGTDRKPKIGVAARTPVRNVSVGFGEAIPQAIALPVRWAIAVLAKLSGAQGHDELAGPADIARASESAPMSTALFMIGSGLTEIGALLGLLALVFALFGWRPRA